MATATISQRTTIGGLTIEGSTTVEGESALTYENTALAAAKSGTLSTRTDNDTGVITSSAHGITEGQKVSVFWSGGSRYNMDVGTVATNTLAIDGGAGDNLPSATTAVTVCVQTEANFAITGNQLQAIAIKGNRRCVVLLSGSDSTVHLPNDLLANEAYTWVNGTTTNPVSGDTVTKLVIANGETSTLTLQAAAVLDV